MYFVCSSHLLLSGRILPPGNVFVGEAEGDETCTVFLVLPYTPAPWAAAREVTDLCLSFCSCKMEIRWRVASDMTPMCLEILCDSQRIHAFLFVTFCRRGVTVLYRPMLMISLCWRTKSGSTVAHSCSEQISNKAAHLPTPKEVVS